MVDSPRPGSDRALRQYWVRGEGAAKINWLAEGSFGRCVTQLGKYVRDPEGLCAEYHHEATGKWPGEKNHHDGAITAAGTEQNMPDFDVEVVDAPLTAAAVTVTIPDAPPPEWFDEPVDMPNAEGAFYIEQNGRVYGRVAPGKVAHRAFRDRRIEVPRGNVDYSRWMKRDGAMVADGGRVTAGPITFDCGHADPTSRDYDARRDHYDNTCSVFASARIGESDDGAVWVAGALMPGVTGEQIARASMCQLSGDWQPHPEQPGKKEFIAALLVPVPGFPSSSGDNGGSRPRASVQVDRDGSLVASFVPVIVAAPVVRVEPDLGPVVERIARQVGRDPVSLVAAARVRVGR
jgi:hypothetical protein